MTDTAESTISTLVQGVAEELDLPRGLRLGAEHEYSELGAWMSANLDDGADWALYSHGSMRLNTVVRPQSGDEYDLDSVAEWDVDKDSITKLELKKVVGEALREYVEASRSRSGAPDRCREKRRCWTLEYDGRPFHLDVLPAVPDVDAEPTGIRLTDKAMTRWLYGDPIAYADWFSAQIAAESLERKTAIAKASRVEVEDIPDAEAPTMLHRVVQVLKIHRDVHFSEDDELKPASILLTTLAAQTYTGAYGVLLAALMDVADRLPDLIEREGDLYVVRNPVQPRENFADRWTDDHARRFRGWLDALRRELDAARSVNTGLDVLVARLGSSFGIDVMRKSADRYGASTAATRSNDGLRVASAGTLTTASGVRVRDHLFHGD